MILVALGANVPGAWGAPVQTLRRSVDELVKSGIRVEACSNLYETLPVGPISQPNFVNAVVRIGTVVPSRALLKVLKDIERRAGRRPARRWGPRCLDLDILDYHGLSRNWTATAGRSGVRRASPSSLPLVLPHPELHRRAFVLVPLRDVAPNWHHPVTGASVDQLLRGLRPGTERGVLRNVGPLRHNCNS